MVPTKRIPRVLIVDDEESIRAFASHTLVANGYDVVVASSGREALRLASQQAPIDLLLTDLVMPGVRGDELATLIRQEQPGLRVIYLTGYRSELFKYRPALWDNEALLEKPVTVKQLLQQVSLSVFGHSRGVDE